MACWTSSSSSSFIDAYSGHAVLVHVPEAPTNIMSAANIEIPAPPSIIADLLATDVDTSCFKGLIPRAVELDGAPFLFYKPNMAQYIRRHFS